MEKRKELLENNCYYHIFSRSIAKYVVFNDAEEYSRMFDILKLCRFSDFNYKYSKFINLESKTQNTIIKNLKTDSPILVEIIAFCIMPTHFHLLLKQVSTRGISNYIARVLNSYSRYFNIKHQRTGPLWAGRFKSVLVSTDEQLLHLTRYIHLNPTSAKLVGKSEDWDFSSYHEYLNTNTKQEKVCSFANLFEFSPKEYKKFVLDRKSYQQEISRIKNILIDNYTG